MIKSSRRLVNPLLLSLLLILLSAVGVMLFRFYSIKSYEEINAKQRFLESATFRTCLRELQRLSLMVPVLKQLDTEREEELRGRIEESMLLFSPDGEIPHMISAIGYRSTEEADRLYRYNGSWENSNESLRHFFNDGDIRIGSGDIMLLGRNPEDPDILIILYRPGELSPYYIQAEMNVEEYRNHYIDPLIREILSEYELKWTITEESGHRIDGDGTDSRFTMKGYRFSPLAALSGRNYKEDKDLRIRVPSSLYLSRPLVLKDNISDDQGETESQETGDNRLFKIIRPYQDEPELVLLAGLPDGPFYLETERRNAIDWLQSMLLLLGIGAIFLILMIQQSRLRQLRIKEKEFVASMTHELRTPLTVIRSASDNLRRGIITPERLPQYGRLIQDQVLRLSTMIEEILMFSSMGGKPRPAESVESELPVLIDEIRASVGTISSERGITLHWDREGLPQRGLGDPDLIRLALNNLIMNSLNHAYPGSESGSVRIKIHYTIPGFLKVVVEDDGRGIAGGEQKKIFQPFYRDRISRQNQEKGSGLGLFITRQKTSAAGGELKLESPYIRLDGKKQQGCRFILSLPFTPVVPREEENQ